MKGSLIVVAVFCVGCLLGVFFQEPMDTHHLSMYVLYALMFQVGIGIGGNKNLKELLRSLRPKMLLVPLATISGTLLFSAFASLLLSKWSIFDCMAVGSGFAYYSLSSILITQFKEPTIGLQLATELGTIALMTNIFREMIALLGAPVIRKHFGTLAPISAKEPTIGLQLATELGTIALMTNIFREMIALLGAPVIRKHFGTLAPISAAGVNSMDVLLPSITRYSGKDMIPVAIFHGILIDLSVPFFVSFFCSL